MSKLHVYIDGSWLLKVVDGTVFERFISDPRHFRLNFSKLNDLMLKHVASYKPQCNSLGNLYFVTSIFELPQDFNKWEGRRLADPYRGTSVTLDETNIRNTRLNIVKREEFASDALEAGYDPNCIYRVPLQEWMLLKLIHPKLKYQEKQVDTTIVALLVRDAIENPDDCFAVVAGDADILPAIKIAYPSYTTNVFPVFTSPDERDERNRQTSFKYSQFEFSIPPLVLQNNVGDIMDGNVYRCTECHKFFTTQRPISQPEIRLPRCKRCR